MPIYTKISRGDFVGGGGGGGGGVFNVLQYTVKPV